MKSNTCALLGNHDYRGDVLAQLVSLFSFFFYQCKPFGQVDFYFLKIWQLGHIQEVCIQSAIVIADVVTRLTACESQLKLGPTCRSG
jgi:hypothetical protein